VGPRAGLDTEARGKIPSPLLGIEPRSPGRPARSQTLLIKVPGSPMKLVRPIKVYSRETQSELQVTICLMHLVFRMV
jgi:hypothetical protein